MEICEKNQCEKNWPLVNKKHGLCGHCNYIRLNGKTKEEVYAERAKGKENKRPSILTQRHPSQKVDGLIKKFSIKKISNKEKYRCSNGDLVSETTIKRKYAEACDEIMLERDMMCQGSGRWDVPLSRSHTISRKRCKEINKTELIWSKDNIELEGYEEPTSNPTMAHNIWEVGNWEQKSKLLNFQRKLEIIKKEDPEQYRKIPDEYK